jgi:stage III sporulation protein AC
VWGAEIIWQLAGIGILVAVIYSVLKQAGRDELAWVVTLGGVAVALLLVIRLINELFQNVRTMFGL